MANERTKCLIIGSGPAGYTAAIYTGRANLHPILYEGMQPGGQLTTTSEVENFPGYPDGVQSFDMMEDMKRQALKFGAEIRRGIVTRIDTQSYPFEVEIDGRTVIEACSVIISTGATAKYLGVKGEAEYMGRGVSACATCDGFFYRGRRVAVVGGGDTACEEANYLANMCLKVYMIVRKGHLRASHAMQKRVKENPNIEILFEHVTKEVTGDADGVTGVVVEHVATGERRELAIEGFFVAIGRTPQTDLFKGQIHLDEEGYIKTHAGTPRTNVKGVFAAGDVADPDYRQAIVAAGSGCMAALEAERFLMLEGEFPASACAAGNDENCELDTGNR